MTSRMQPATSTADATSVEVRAATAGMLDRRGMCPELTLVQGRVQPTLLNEVGVTAELLRLRLSVVSRWG